MSDINQLKRQYAELSSLIDSAISDGLSFHQVKKIYVERKALKALIELLHPVARPGEAAGNSMGAI